MPCLVRRPMVRRVGGRTRVFTLADLKRDRRNQIMFLVLLSAAVFVGSGLLAVVSMLRTG
jgi:hypothetical protein